MAEENTQQETQQATEQTSQQESSQQSTGTLTESEANSRAAAARREAQAEADRLKAQLESYKSTLGDRSPEDVAVILKAQQEAEERNQTEAQKAAKRAEKLEKQLGDLSPKAEKADRYEVALQSFLEREREGVPQYILDLFERTGMDPVDQLNYIGEHREEFGSQERQVTRRSEDTSRTDRTQSREDAMDAFDKQLRQKLGFTGQ